MAEYGYTILFEPMPEGGFNVVIPAIPEDLHVRWDLGRSLWDGARRHSLLFGKRPRDGPTNPRRRRL